MSLGNESGGVPAVMNVTPTGGSHGGYSSRRGGSRGGRGGYSRDDGRSEMMEHLEKALDSASEEDREAVKRFIRQLESA